MFPNRSLSVYDLCPGMVVYAQEKDGPDRLTRQLTILATGSKIEYTVFGWPGVAKHDMSQFMGMWEEFELPPGEGA